ncbi:MAG: aminoglycoside phosphotransferase family protein [Methylomicrobium sp.]|nr:aminoglycoside phosphotransferase family protein [Methylomicrobium sp.]
MPSLLDIASQFTDSAQIAGINPLGEGLINDTYLVTTFTGGWVLQRINPVVFPDPKLVIRNMAVLNRHIAETGQNTLKLQIPGIIQTQSGEDCVSDQQGHTWRAITYIPNTISLETVESPGQARQTGFALGHFHRLLNKLNPTDLYDTLPGFHIAPEYLSRYRQVLSQTNTLHGSADSRFCLDFIDQYEELTRVLENAKHQGLLKLRAIHGDPKFNNFLFDKDTREITSLIDLDTVKPGLLHYDIGDCVRSLCQSPAGQFNLEICEALLTGYLEETSSFLTEDDYAYLYRAIQLIPFELGLRFFTDFLEGNRYFKVTTPHQNRSRAIAQFQLCESISKQEAEIKSLIERLYNRAM